jgi:plasmid stabilization system protein ParE
MVSLVITGLHHDAGRKRSIVYVRWEDDAEKNLGLIVPYGCRLEDARDEAAKAVQALAAELASATVKLEPSS